MNGSFQIARLKMLLEITSRLYNCPFACIVHLKCHTPDLSLPIDHHRGRSRLQGKSNIGTEATRGVA